jgi:hypothetical protein
MSDDERNHSVWSARPAERCSGLRALEAAPYYELFVDDLCRLVIARRTAIAFANESEIVACFTRVERLLAHVPRAQYGLLVDVRRGPARNDPSFETTAAAHRGKLLLGFAKNAALAASAAGRLQIQRYSKADGRQVFATDDENAAFAYLGAKPHVLSR